MTDVKKLAEEVLEKLKKAADAELSMNGRASFVRDYHGYISVVASSLARAVLEMAQELQNKREAFDAYFEAGLAEAKRRDARIAENARMREAIEEIISKCEGSRNDFEEGLPKWIDAIQSIATSAIKVRG